MKEILFPFGVRISTWLTIGAFLGLALWRRDWRPLVAGVAWIWGFEILFQVTAIVAGHDDTSTAARLGWVLLGVPIVVCASNWVRPDPWLLAAAICVFGAWVASGFHVNDHTMVGFDTGAEVLNEAAKILWAAAYLWPLWSRDRRQLRTRRRGRHGNAPEAQVNI